MTIASFFDRIAAPVVGADGRRRSLLKRLLPSTLFARTLLIIVTPVVLAQGIATYIFYDRHWDNVTGRFASAVAGEIALTVEELREGPSPARREVIFRRAQRNTGLAYVLRPNGELAGQSDAPADLMQRQLASKLRARLPYDFTVGGLAEADQVLVEIRLPEGLLRVEAPTGRLFTGTAQLFYAWMVGSTVVLFAVAIAFMRNQIRPIRRLAAAADAFGKGRDAPGFRPEGATEVRQAAQAFLEMRDRIGRQIAQRTEMLAGVSHDLRTPLTRMKLQLALLGDGPDVEELKADVDEMVRMIDGYLAFARGEDGEPAVPTDLGALLEDVAGRARREGARVELAPDAPIVLPLRPEALRRCLANLLSNANRHADRVWIATRLRDDVIEIVIDDDGPGMPEEQYEEALKPFVRLDRSRNETTGGAGLGLAIARDIARSHGGDLRLARAPQGGLRCVLRLPL